MAEARKLAGFPYASRGGGAFRAKAATRRAGLSVGPIESSGTGATPALTAALREGTGEVNAVPHLGASP